MRLDPVRAGQDRQNLAAALRDLRKAEGLSGERLARRCGMSQSKVSRIENGRLLPSVLDVELLLRALAVDEDTRAELQGLAQVANAEYQDIRETVRRGLHHRQRELAAQEADATRMRHFLPALITGLLQTPDYLRAGMRTAVPPTSRDPAKAIALKLERQAVLHDGRKSWDFLLTEQAVRWKFCTPDIMAEQIDHLIAVSQLPNVSVGIIPLSAQIAQGAMSTFVIYDARLVTVELFTGLLVLRDPRDVEHYANLFDYFSSHALWANDAHTVLHGVAQDFREEDYSNT
ncbi:MAG: helix-turn-helix domain-containing protein [Micromonosporaceae bacterium]